MDMTAAVEPDCSADTTMRLAFRARRRWLGLTQRTLADRIGAAAATVRKWENCGADPRPHFRRPLCEALKVNMVELDYLLDPGSPLMPAGGLPLLNGKEVPEWLSHFDLLVETAGHLVEADRAVVPALLQTGAYAAAIERTSRLRFSEHQVAERVQVRLARQEALDRAPNPLELVAVLPELVLLDAYGGAGVMGEQLDHLVAMAERPNVEIRALPADGRAGDFGIGYELVTKRGSVRAYMAVTFDPTGPNYHETDVQNFIDMTTYLLDLCLDPTATVDLIRTTREQRYR